MTPAARLLLIALVVVAVSGCYLHRDPDSLRVSVAVPEVPSTLDPHVDDQPGSRHIRAALYDALTQVDERGALNPALAVSWQAVGPTTWEFKLRPGVRFRTGEEVNAHTVAANVRRVLRPDLRSPVLKEIPTLLRANPRDLYTVVISTRRPDPILPRRLAALYIVPTDYLARIGEEKFGQEPSGTGPWSVPSFVPEDHVTLQARKGSWRGAPQVRTIEFRHTPSEAARVAALVNGTAHVALDLPPAQVGELRSHGLQVTETPVAAARVITLVATTDEAPLAETRIRQALNYAIDKDALVTSVVGSGIPLDGQVVGREAHGFNDKIQTTYPYDPERARQLLSEAGFPNGFALRIHHPVSMDGQEERELRLISAYLEQVRVRVTLQPSDLAQHTQRRLAGLLTPAFYETLAYHSTLDASAVMDYYGLDRSLGFIPTYNNDDFEEIYKLTRSENSPSIRLQALQVSMGLLSESPPAIFLYQPVRIHATAPSVADFRAAPTLLIDFDHLSR